MLLSNLAVKLSSFLESFSIVHDTLDPTKTKQSHIGMDSGSEFKADAGLMLSHRADLGVDNHHLRDRTQVFLRKQVGKEMNKLLFSTIDVTRQAFFRTAHAYAIVNLKPIVPGHVLVVPTRVVQRLTDLSPTEVGALFTSVQLVGRVVERAYSADGLTIACLDGLAAGQSVPHVHVHVIPRRLPGRTDGIDAFSENNDAVYPALDDAEHALPSDLQAVQHKAEQKEEERKRANPLKVDADDARPSRTMEDMVREADWLRGLFVGESQRED